MRKGLPYFLSRSRSSHSHLVKKQSIKANWDSLSVPLFKAMNPSVYGGHCTERTLVQDLIWQLHSLELAHPFSWSALCHTDILGHIPVLPVTRQALCLILPSWKLMVILLEYSKALKNIFLFRSSRNTRVFLWKQSCQSRGAKADYLLCHQRRWTYPNILVLAWGRSGSGPWSYNNPNRAKDLSSHDQQCVLQAFWQIHLYCKECCWNNYFFHHP